MLLQVVNNCDFVALRELVLYCQGHQYRHGVHVSERLSDILYRNQSLTEVSLYLPISEPHLIEALGSLPSLKRVEILSPLRETAAVAAAEGCEGSSSGGKRVDTIRQLREEDPERPVL